MSQTVLIAMLPRGSSWVRPLLFLICGITDFAVFIVVFMVSRGLAEQGADPMRLGIAGAGLSFSSGIFSLIGGWLAQRIEGRVVFLSGAFLTVVSCALCWALPSSSMYFMLSYWLVGLGTGFLYPPLVGWLNEGEHTHLDRQGVSRTLILFCLAWNFGMLCGQLSAGDLFLRGRDWTFGTAFAAALLNLVVAIIVTRLPRREEPENPTPPPTATAESPELGPLFKRLSWFANIGGMFGGSMVLHLLPDLVVAIGIDPELHGQLLAGWRSVIILTYLLMHRLTFWHYRLRTALISQALGAVGLVVISQANSPTTLLIGLALLGQLVGYNYFAGLFYSTAGSTENKRALAAGIHEATLAAGMAIGTIVGGALGSGGHQRRPYACAAGVVLALIVVQIVVWRNRVRRRTDATISETVDPMVAARASEEPA